jgi:hypothetical protein
MGDPKVMAKDHLEAYDHVGPSFEQIEIQEAWARVEAHKRRRFAKEQAEIAASTFNYCSSHSDEYCEIENGHTSYMFGANGFPFFARFDCECAPFVHPPDREAALMCYYAVNAPDIFAEVVRDEIPALISALEVYYLKNGIQRTMPNYFVSEAAVEVLAAIGMEAAPALLEANERSDDPFVRAGTAKALRMIKQAN